MKKWGVGKPHEFLQESFPDCITLHESFVSPSIIEDLLTILTNLGSLFLACV
jgi:hypothetical protein